VNAIYNKQKTAKSKKNIHLQCIFTLYNCHTANVKHTISIRQVAEYEQKSLLRTNLLPFCIHTYTHLHTLNTRTPIFIKRI